MKLAAIYNVWDGVELLKGSIDSIINHIDLLIIVYQSISNYGEKFDPSPDIVAACESLKIPVIIHRVDIEQFINPGRSEAFKRNIGIKLARESGATHFVHLDCDEYYSNFGILKFQYGDKSDGSVCKMYTYFKRPTLMFEEPDNYYVPFIHRLLPWTQAAQNVKYPHYVDPTRKINTTDVVKLDAEFMHHFSWVRVDIERKIRNSTARKNIEKSGLLECWKIAKPGLFVSGYNQVLIDCENKFGIELPDPKIMT